MYLHGKKSGRETGRERCLAYLSKNINVNVEKKDKKHGHHRITQISMNERRPRVTTNAVRESIHGGHIIERWIK